MAWIYFRELVESQSLSDLGSEQSPIAKSINTARASYCRECDQVTLAKLPCGTMCELSKRNCSPKSTSSTADSRARILALQAAALAWSKAVARDSSSKSRALPKKYVQLSSSLKTSRRSGHADFLAFSLSSPPSGMIVGGRLYLPQTLEPHTYANGGSSLLPTPTLAGGYNRGGAAGRVGKIRPSLEMMAKKNLWPTPRTTGLDGGSHSRAAAKERGMAVGGTLNPTWVEWLMGYPSEWTVCADWAMPSSRSKPVSPSKG